tara:strand:+ start:272 stop:577 length:306 start_codon:yes stop_codon:yes gene_type:complete
MQHIKLSDDTILRSEKQVAEKFLIVHKEHADKEKDLKTIKAFVRTNAWDWAMHGIKVTAKKGRLAINEKQTLEVLLELGATSEQIASCYKQTAGSIAIGKS